MLTSLIPSSCQTNPTIYCSFYLFHFNGQFVEINLVGALIPILLSLLFLVLLKGRFLIRITKYSLLVGLLYTFVWSGYDAVEGGISTIGFLYAATLFAVAFVWIKLNRTDLKNDRIWPLIFQTFAVGTFGLFLADIFRVAGGLFAVPYLRINAPLEVIGGAYVNDAIFRSGIYFVFSVFLLWMIIRIVSINVLRRQKEDSKRIAL